MPTEPFDQPRLPPCSALEQQYEVIDLLGKGGRGYVFHAKHKTLPRHAAIKVLSENLQPDSRARFEQEARAASSLSHPNIVDVYDFGIADDGSPYCSLIGALVYLALRSDRLVVYRENEHVFCRP